MSFHNRGTAGSNPLYQTNNLGGMLSNLVHDSVYDKTRIQRMYQYPAKLDDALMHKKANEFGYNSKTINGKPAPLCPCCELPINTVRIKLKYGTTPSKENVKAGSNIFLLNPGSTMFFTFIKMTIAYLLLRFILSDCYNLISNTSATSCNQQGTRETCSKNAMAKFSTFNKQTFQDEAMLYAVDILNLVTIIVSIVFFLYYRKYQYQVYQLTDIGVLTQSEYSVFIENIPIFLPYSGNNLDRNTISALQFDYEQDLRILFEECIDQFIQNVKANQGASNKLSSDFYKLLLANPSMENGHKVTSVTLCFDLTEMEKLNKMRQEMMANHNENVQNNIKQDQNSINYIPTQIECLNQEYINLSKKFAMDNTASFNLSHFVGKAFISFEYEHYKQYLLQYLRQQKGLKLRGQTLKINSAAEPSDIYWFNMKISDSERRKSIIYSFVIMFMTLIFSFSLIFGLQFYQSSKNNAKKMPGAAEHDNVALNYLFTIAMTTITTAINFLLADFIAKLTNWENHKTKTDYIVSLMIKTVIAQFANTAVIYYIVSVVEKLTLSQDKTSPLDENGLVMEVTSLVAVSGVIQIILNIIQPGVLFGKLMNWYKYRGKQTINKFQIEFNNQMQDPEFDFSNRYAYYIVNVYIVSFYSYITPYIGIILVIIFIIQYWVDKYNLFQRFSCPVDFNYRLSRLTLKAFECSVFVFALGNLLFSIAIHTTKEQTKYHILNLISFFVALAYCIAIMFLPKKWFERIEDEDYQTTAYSQCLKNKDFKKVYWLSNPATSFAKEPDVNNKERFVDYGDMNEFADAEDFNQFMEAEKNGEYEVETYSPDAEKFVAENIIKQAGNQLVKGLIDGDGDGDIDILGRLANGAK